MIDERAEHKNVADYDIDHGNRNEESKVEEEAKLVERKEYTLWEDLRMLDAIDEWTVTHGGNTKGFYSQSFWNKLVDPKSGKRLLDGTRTSESLRDHYKRTLTMLTGENIAAMREYAADKDEEALKHAFLIFKKDGTLKKYCGIANKPGF